MVDAFPVGIKSGYKLVFSQWAWIVPSPNPNRDLWSPEFAICSWLRSFQSRHLKYVSSQNLNFEKPALVSSGRSFVRSPSCLLGLHSLLPLAPKGCLLLSKSPHPLCFVYSALFNISVSQKMFRFFFLSLQRNWKLTPGTLCRETFWSLSLYLHLEMQGSHLVKKKNVHKHK